MLINLSCTWPHTLYRGVRQLAPASVTSFDADGKWVDDGAAYWRPLEHNPYRNVGEAAAALRTAVTEDVRAAVQGERTVGLLLSGGEDARAVLGAVPEGVEVRSFVYADWENREVRVARAAAKAYGASLTFGQRTRDHYVDGLQPVSSIIGAHNNFMDVHGWGLHERLGIRDLPVVLGGLSSDSFLKAEHAPSVAPSDSFELPAASAIRPELREAVITRRLEFRRWLAEVRPSSAAEWERLWPFTQRRHSANLHGNRRLFASHEVYHANAVVAIAAAVPPAWKQHRRLFHLAMKPLFRRSWHVPHARWRFPYFGAAANLPLSAGLRVTRGVRALLTGEVRARQQPWPKWRVVARSDAATRAMAALPPLDTPLRAIFTEQSAEALAASIRAEWHPLRELFLLQLAFLATEAERP
nr:asparagine synthase-related protein [Longimicrobium terrae]